MTIANGNDGDLGPFSESSGSNGEFVLAVASVPADTVAESTFQVTLETGMPRILPPSRTRPVCFGILLLTKVSIVPFNADPMADNSACHTFNDGNNGNYTNSIVLVSVGNCTFQTKQTVIDFIIRSRTLDNRPLLCLFTRDQYPISPSYNSSSDNTVAFILAAQGQESWKRCASVCR